MQNFSVVNEFSLCTDKVKNVAKDPRLLYVFPENISGMTLAFPCIFEESNKVNIVEVPLPSLISGVIIVLVSSKISCFRCLSCRWLMLQWRLWRNCLLKLHPWTIGYALFRDATKNSHLVVIDCSVSAPWDVYILICYQYPCRYHPIFIFIPTMKYRVILFLSSPRMFCRLLN